MGRVRARRTYLLVLFAVSAGIAGSVSNPASAGVGSAVERPSPMATDFGRSMIVSFDRGSSALASAAISAPGPDVDRQSLPGGAGFVATLTSREIAALRRTPGVLAVTPNHRLYPAAAEHLERINAPAAWTLGWRGEGETIVVIDTGVDPAAADLDGRVVAEACFTPAGDDGGDCPNGGSIQTGPGAAAPCTGQFECGHGTMVASIAVGGDGQGLSGVAPASDLIAVRVFASVAENTTRIATDEATLIRALNWVETQLATRSIAAVNLSLGGAPIDAQCAASPALGSVLSRLASAGVAVVASAGNDASATALSFPACVEDVISVGAEGDPGRAATFSNISATLDLTAPGRAIEGAWPDPCCSRNLSGTSFAAPQVAAAFALLRQQEAPGSVASRLDLLRRTGEPVYAFQTGSWSAASSIRLDRALDQTYQSLQPARLASSAAPTGVVDELRPEVGGFRVRGWALDPDSVIAVPIHVYVDGVFTESAEASDERPDVAAAFAGYGPLRGFDLPIVVEPGVHDVCVYGLDVGRGPGNVLIGCRAEVSGAAMGAFDEAMSVDGQITVRGWAIDTGHAGPTAVQVLVDGQPVGAALAAENRPDLGPYFPAYGTRHGYSTSVPASPGVHDVCVRGFGSTSAVGPTVFGCRQVSVDMLAPTGVIDSAVADRGSVTITGWAIDPDTVEPIDVTVRLDGVAHALRADKERPDVAAVLPVHGPRHGFDWSRSVTSGPHEICVAGVDTHTGMVTDFGCRSIVAA